MKGEVAQVKEKIPKKMAAKSTMEALRATAESLEVTLGLASIAFTLFQPQNASIRIN
jgi:hypothetical protein